MENFIPFLLVLFLSILVDDLLKTFKFHFDTIFTLVK